MNIRLNDAIARLLLRTETLMNINICMTLFADQYLSESINRRTNWIYCLEYCCDRSKHNSYGRSY